MGLLATLFLHPIRLPENAKLWMVLPLTLCVAIVYRATRAYSVSELPRATLITFLSILTGMVLIAAAALGVHELVLRLGA